MLLVPATPLKVVVSSEYDKLSDRLLSSTARTAQSDEGSDKPCDRESLAGGGLAMQCWGPVADVDSQIIEPGLFAVGMMEM